MFSFKDIKGCKEVKRSITHLITNDRFPHAALYLGNEGNEKLRLAYATARMLLCESPLTDDCCGRCISCIKSGHFNHPDILFSFPFVKTAEVNQCEDCMTEWKDSFEANPYMNIFEWAKSGENSNKQVNINVAECLRIVKELSMRPYESDQKVMIIWMPEYLAREGNRLLKIIEEPPEATYIIFVGEESDKVLNTILSRCQLFKVPPVETTHLADILHNQFGKDQEIATITAAMANGNVMEALSLFSEDNQNYNEVFINWLRKCYLMNRKEIVDWCDQFARYDKEVQKYILSFGIHFMQEMSRCMWNPDYDAGLSSDWKLTLKNLIPLMDFEKVERLTKILENEIYFVERNCNMKIQLLSTSIELHQLLLKPVAVI